MPRQGYTHALRPYSTRRMARHRLRAATNTVVAAHTSKVRPIPSVSQGMLAAHCPAPKISSASVSRRSTHL